MNALVDTGIFESFISANITEEVDLKSYNLIDGYGKRLTDYAGWMVALS